MAPECCSKVYMVSSIKKIINYVNECKYVRNAVECYSWPLNSVAINGVTVSILNEWEFYPHNNKTELQNSNTLITSQWLAFKRNEQKARFKCAYPFIIEHCSNNFTLLQWFIMKLYSTLYVLQFCFRQCGLTWNANVKAAFHNFVSKMCVAYWLQCPNTCACLKERQWAIVYVMTECSITVMTELTYDKMINTINIVENW